jgi:hypothetical protein
LKTAIIGPNIHKYILGIKNKDVDWFGIPYTIKRDIAYKIFKRYYHQIFSVGFLGTITYFTFNRK